MNWTGNVGCQNCITLNKKLELFELLKQKCCKTDDITKNFLILKTSYEKSAKVLENKSKKLSEARSKIKDAEKAEEIFKRKAAEFQLRLVSSDNKCQELSKDLDIEREKNVFLVQEKVCLENQVEIKENEIASLNVMSKQCEEKFANEINSLNAKMEKKIDSLKSEIQKLQELNSKLKSQGNQKKRHDKLREDIVDIFKDGLFLVGEPLKRFKRLLNRLQENETAAKLEAILDTPSLTPDGTTSSDTGVFSGDEDLGCPSLGNDLEMSSDSDEDFETVQLQSKVTWSVPSSSNPEHFKMPETHSSPLEDPLPNMDTESTQDISGSNLSNESVNDGDGTLCPILSDSTTDGFDMDSKLSVLASASENNKCVDAKKSLNVCENSKFFTKAEDFLNNVDCDLNVINHRSCTSPRSRTSSPNSTVEKSSLTTATPAVNVSNVVMTDSLFSPPGGDISSSLKSLKRNDNYEISFDVASSLTNENCVSSLKMVSTKSDAEVPNVSLASEVLTSKSDGELKDIIPCSAETSISTSNGPSTLLLSNANLEKSPKPQSKEKGDNLYLSGDLGLDIDVHLANSISPAVSVHEISHDPSAMEKSNSGTLIDMNRPIEKDNRSSTHNTPNSCYENIQDLADECIQESEPQEDVMDLDSMLHEWSPPTPVLPFSDDSCGFDGSSSLNQLIQDLPKKLTLTVSVGTNTDIKHCKSTASSPISFLFMKNSSTSTDDFFKQEKTFQDAFSSPPRLSFSNKASSPMKIRCKNIGVMPIAELTRDVAVSPMKVMKKNSATSPSRSLYRDVSVSPLQLQKVNSATNLSSDTENIEESWSHEAKILQQTLEVLGISTSDSSGAVLDQSLVDKLRKAMEMALGKTSTADIGTSSRKPVPAKQFNTSYCSFDPCEFAEICNQQHYNLHLLAKAKNVERTICLREKKRKHKLKRLKGSSRKSTTLSTLSFKEEILEDYVSSQKKMKRPSNILEDPHFENTASDDSFIFRSAISPKTQLTKSVPYSDGVAVGKSGDQVNHVQSQVSVISPKTSKSVEIGTNHPSKNNSNIVTEAVNENASCELLSPMSNASDDHIERIPSAIERNPLNSARPISKKLTISSSPLFENTASDELRRITPAISPLTQVTKSVPYPKSDKAKPDKPVEWIKHAQTSTSVTNPKISKYVEPGAIQPRKNDVNIDIRNCLEVKKSSASLELLNPVSNTLDVDPSERIPSGTESNSLDLATSKKKKDQFRCEPSLSDSHSSEDDLVIDESISGSSPISPEVPDCSISTEEACKQPVDKTESVVSDVDPFVLPKPVRMSLRKRQQSSSSESSNAESSFSLNDNPVLLRRSPRTKKTRIAYDGNSEVLQAYRKGYSKFVKGETSIPCEDNKSTEKQPKQTSNNCSPSKVCDDTLKKKVETSIPCEANRSTEKHSKQISNNFSPSKLSETTLAKLSSFKFQPPLVKNVEEQPKCENMPSVPESLRGRNSCISNTKLRDRSLKRSAENKSMGQESSKRIKPSSTSRPSVQSDLCVVDKISTTSEIVDKGLQNSNIDMECEMQSVTTGNTEIPTILVSSMECDVEQSVATENTKAPTIRASSVARKPTKLQKLRTCVSKVHPMVQGTRFARSPEVARDLLSYSKSVDHCMGSPEISKTASTSDPKLLGDSKDESSIIEMLRSRGTVRMAAAASGRTAQLIQVKPGPSMHQRPPVTDSRAGNVATKSVTRVARTQPLVRPADRISALGSNAPSTPSEKSEKNSPPISTIPTSESPTLLNGDSQNLAVQNTLEAFSGETEVSAHQTKEAYVSSLISDIDLRTSTFNPLVCALDELENSPSATCDKKGLIHTQILVARVLKEFTAAPSFTPSVLQKAVDALSAPSLYFILPVIVQKIVKMMDDDYDTSPLQQGYQQSFAPPLSPVQQQLVTLVVQLSSQHEHMQQLPHQLLRLLEYRVFRLGQTPEGDRLGWCSKLYAAICRIYGLRSQVLIFCWDSLYALRSRSYYVVRAVMDVWPYIFPISPSFENACPNAQVLFHLLRAHVEDKNGLQQAKFDNSWLKRLLRSRGLQSPSINSSILASSIFSNIISGATDTSMAALVLLAKREQENWTLKDVVSMKLIPALDSWRNGSLSNAAGERIIWILCSILRAIPPERNGNTSHTLMKLLISELLKPDSTLPPQMQEVIAIGLAMLSRHDLENVAVALASWNPKHGSSRGFSSRLIQYLSSVINNSVRPVAWWQSMLVQFSKSKLE